MRRLNYESMVGQKYNRLTIVEAVRLSGQWVLKCICDCGKETHVKLRFLKSGAVKSCGCYHKEISKELFTIHGMSKHPLHAVWRSMLSRCNTHSASRYEYYGARGIKVCNEWSESGGKGFMAFYDWCMSNGWREGLTIDRIDVNGNYEPMNCQCITMSEQCHNQRLRKNNMSGVNGVCWSKAHNRWLAQITINNKNIRLGQFKAFEEAVEARKQGEIKYWQGA